MMESSNDEEDRLVQAELARGMQGIHELEISFSGERGLHRHFRHCKKNPGHRQFIPLDKFKLYNLPQGVRSTKTLITIHQLAARTVKLSVNAISKQRPSTFSFAHLAGQCLLTVGSGYVTDLPRSDALKEFPCPFLDCQEHPGPHSVYGNITVVTAAHVVCDDEEARNTTVEFFYDSSEDKSGVRKARGMRLGAVSEDGDFCELVCVTHDPLLFKEVHLVSVPSYLLPPQISQPILYKLFEKDVAVKEIKQPLVKFPIRCICKPKATKADDDISVVLTNSGDIMSLKNELSIERNATTASVKGLPFSCQYFNRDVSIDINFIITLFQVQLPEFKSSVTGDTITFLLPTYINPRQLSILVLWDVPAIRKAIYHYLNISCPCLNLLKHVDPASEKLNTDTNATVQSSDTVMCEILDFLHDIKAIDTSFGKGFNERNNAISVFHINQLLLEHHITSFNRLCLWDVENGVATVTVTFHDEDPKLSLLQKTTSGVCPNFLRSAYYPFFIRSTWCVEYPNIPWSAECPNCPWSAECPRSVQCPNSPRSAKCPNCMHIICVCPVMFRLKRDLIYTSLLQFPASYKYRYFEEEQLFSSDSNEKGPQIVDKNKTALLKTRMLLGIIKDIISDFDFRNSMVALITFQAFREDNPRQDVLEIEHIICDMFQNIIKCLLNLPLANIEEIYTPRYMVYADATFKLVSDDVNLYPLYDVCTFLEEYTKYYDFHQTSNSFEDILNILNFICSELPNNLDFLFTIITGLKETLNLDMTGQEKMSPEEEMAADSVVIHISHPHGQSKHVTIGELTECWTGDGHYHPLYTADTCPGSSGGPTWVITSGSPKETYGFTHSGCVGNQLNRGSAWTLYPAEEI